MNVLLLDAYNLMHRARHSMTRGYNGNHTIVYSFFRGLRPIIEKFNPDKIYFVLEGYPKKRIELAEDYKANRVYHDRDGFQEQKRTIIRIMKDYFPVEVVRHKNYECDDVLANLIRYEHPDDDTTVITTDTDFLQLYNEHEKVQVYSPTKKKFFDHPRLDYVMWKSLRGDSADNIPGFPGIGNKRARALVQDTEKLKKFLSEAPDRQALLDKNLELIRFHDLLGEMDELERSPDTSDWSAVKKEFYNMKFFSIINDRSWEKYTSTFR